MGNVGIRWSGYFRTSRRGCLRIRGWDNNRNGSWGRNRYGDSTITMPTLKTNLRVWSPWLSRTHQLWKVLVVLLLLALSGIGFVYGISQLNPDPLKPTDAIIFLPLASVIGIGSLILYLVSIRCPSCKVRVAYRIVKVVDSKKWLSDVLHLQCCPFCGEAGDGGPTKPHGPDVENEKPG